MAYKHKNHLTITRQEMLGIVRSFLEHPDDLCYDLEFFKSEYDKHHIALVFDDNYVDEYKDEDGGENEV